VWCAYNYSFVVLLLNHNASMGKSYLSRHFVGGRATSLASIPFAAAGQVDAAGISTTHNVLAYAGWNEDLQVCWDHVAACCAS